MKVLWLIPARSGSKGIPDKCIKILGDKPLLAHRICHIPPSHPNSKVWISTDSPEYAKIAERYGYEVPFIRPKHLSGDTASTVDVVLHAMTHAESLGHVFDYIGVLQPTSPYVEAFQLQQALKELSANPSANGIVAVREVKPHTSLVQDKSLYLDALAVRLKNIDQLGRQSFPIQVTPCGGFYISTWDSFRTQQTFFTTKTLSFTLRGKAVIDIDDSLDWQIAEALNQDEQIG